MTRAGLAVQGVVAVVAVVCAAAASAQEQRPAAEGVQEERSAAQTFRQPRPMPREELPILAAGGPSAAGKLTQQGWCSTDEPGLPVARLSWVLPEQPGARQRVDVTMFRDGFETGRFLTFGGLEGDVHEVLWQRLEPGINYYWRVLTLTPEGWVPSATGRCAAPICPADRPRESR